MFPFHRPFKAKNELHYLQEVLASGQTANGGKFSKLVEQYFSKMLGMHCFFTNSCTAALELSSLLIEIKPGDEIILPTYTYPSTANAFALRGAKLVFADSSVDHPNIDLNIFSQLVSKKTKAFLPMYYGGVSINWKEIENIKKNFNFYIIEEAAHSIGSFYLSENEKIPLGSLGDYSVYSFHETKNISCGEGGLLALQSESKLDKAEKLFEKGTNKRCFHRGEVDYYEWCSLGSSYGGSEIQAAILMAQLEELEKQNSLRLNRWNYLFNSIAKMDHKNVMLPRVPVFSKHNAHVFYLVFSDDKTRKKYETFMSNYKIPVYSHYRCLHQSAFGNKFKQKGCFDNAEYFQNGLARITLNPEIDQNLILEKTEEFFKSI